MSMDCIAKIEGASISLEGKCTLTLAVEDADVLRRGYDNYKGCERLDVTIRKHREARTKEANSYFHALARDIAAALSIPAQQAKNMLIGRYGQPELLEDGSQLTYISPAPVEYMAALETPHTVPIGYEDGRTIYAVYRGSHTYSKEEMSALLDGTISEAMQLGIDVYPASRVNEIKSKWKPGGT